MGFLWFNQKKNIIEKDEGTRSETVKRIPLIQPLSLDGTSASANNMNVDGSITPVRFYIQPNIVQKFYITRMIFMLADSGSFDSGGWGNNGGVSLVNGINIGFINSGLDTKINLALKSHSDLALLAYDVNKISWGTGDQFLMSRFTFSKLGTEIKLDGDNNDIFYVDINDDLTYLTQQNIIAEGYIVQ